MKVLSLSLTTPLKITGSYLLNKYLLTVYYGRDLALDTENTAES